MTKDFIASPLSEEQQQHLGQLLGELRSDQVYWLAGYLAGYCVSAPPAVALPEARPRSSGPDVARLTILFGSQTGNAEGVAEKRPERPGSGFG